MHLDLVLCWGNSIAEGRVDCPWSADALRVAVQHDAAMRIACSQREELVNTSVRCCCPGACGLTKVAGWPSSQKRKRGPKHVQCRGSAKFEIRGDVQASGDFCACHFDPDASNRDEGLTASRAPLPCRRRSCLEAELWSPSRRSQAWCRAWKKAKAAQLGVSRSPKVEMDTIR